MALAADCAGGIFVGLLMTVAGIRILREVTITLPNTVLGERTRDPVGTGPYRLVSWEPGTSVVLERFEDYWSETPEVAKVTYVFRGESAVRAAMVAAGEADIAPNIAVQDATDPSMDFSYLNSETSSFRIDVSKPPLDDLRVRKAMTSRSIATP